jgi:hypothetical protein
MQFVLCGVAIMADNAEHFDDDVAVDGCRLLGKGLAGIDRDRWVMTIYR